MKYLLTIYVNPEGMRAMDDELLEEFARAHNEIQTEIRASGEFVDTSELSMVDARTVRTAEGNPLVTEGPYTEGHDIVGGFYLVDVASMDRAVELAGRFVEARFAPVEVRRMGA